MPKLKKYQPGQRYNVWIPSKYMPIWLQIENRSKFVQLALDQAVGIMAFAIIKERKNLKETGKIEDVIDEYNEKFPMGDLTKRKQEVERTNQRNKSAGPQSDRELW